MKRKYIKPQIRIVNKVSQAKLEINDGKCMQKISSKSE